MSRFFNASLSNLTPYTPGEQSKQLQLVKLNTNESPYPPSPLAVQAAVQISSQLNLYSDPTANPLKQGLAQTFEVESTQIFVGNGSDEVLAFCFQAFCQAGSAFPDITYGFYPVFAELYQSPSQIIPLQSDFSIALEDYQKIEATLLIANPNAPTGMALSVKQIQTLLEQNSNRLVIVDEAYVDFGGVSCVSLLRDYDNLLVVGTFSKSRNLAGARLGYAVGSQELIRDLERIKYSFNPYNVNQVTQDMALAALQDRNYFEQCCSNIIQTRQFFCEALAQRNFVCTNSLGNFVFAKHNQVDGKTLYTALRQRNILVRWFDVDTIRQWLRITIGTLEQMQTLLAALDELLPELSQQKGE